MILKGLDLNILANLSSQQIDHVTCLECCKYYVTPATASCGHTLCDGCWHGRRKCPTCASPVERKTLQLNIPLKSLTEHIVLLVDAFEKLFNIKLDEFAFEVLNKRPLDDPNKNVKEWLSNSQNQFSAPISSQSTQESNQPVEFLTSKIQIHTSNIKMKSPDKIVHVPLPQDDWDKIESMPDAEEYVTKKQINTDEPMNIDSFHNEDAYTIDNPRRSTRNTRDNNDSLKEVTDMATEKTSTKSSTIVSIKPSKKIKQTWNNVKKMKKEFSKLNKENRNKLNVSIEMCKKTQVSKVIAKQLDNDKLSPVIDEIITPANIEGVNKKQISTYIGNILQDNPQISTFVTNLINKSPQRNEGIEQNNNTPNENGNKSKDDNTTAAEKIHSKENKEEAFVKFIKKGALQTITHDEQQPITIDNKEFTTSTDDIQISIKIGNTITNICIKKKDSDIQFKVNTDREIQTSLGIDKVLVNNVSVCNNKGDAQNVEVNLYETDSRLKAAQTKNTQVIPVSIDNRIENKSILTKKSTASADTKVAQFEITESVEKELSDIMECVENDTVKDNQYDKGATEMQGSSQKENIPEDIEDIFDSEFSKTPKVHLLKAAKNVPSRILVPTQNKNNKRKQEENMDASSNNDNYLHHKKKQKVINNEHLVAENKLDKQSYKIAVNDSNCNTYDMVMDKVFANIDKDMEMMHKDLNFSQKNKIGNMPKLQSDLKKLPDKDDIQKYSENIFSILDPDDSSTTNSNTQTVKQALSNIKAMTPKSLQRNTPVQEEIRDTGDEEMMELSTPLQENDDSDKSVVEETPQKNVSIPKQNRQRSSTSFQADGNIHSEQRTTRSGQKQSVKSVINLTDSVSDSTKATKDNTVIEISTARKTLETPLTINKFVDQIKHKSTPVARKSLRFDRQNVTNIDPDQTLCPSTLAVAKTTQEREFMNEVFNQVTPAYEKPFINRSLQTKFCIAGSCLTPLEVAKLKVFCKEKGWSYVDKYTKDLTHLVVGVDEENRSQRSVKYMCALAAGKWIISYAWVDKCIQSRSVLPEEPYETLDGTGEPGPRRSRLAKRKLFEGITFHCMEPFSVLELDTLKEILETSGGRVVDDATEVQVRDERPALLLAEPEHTQEDRFIYLAMELSIVPVNYEWVLNCLGSYSISSIHELLLCPSSLLPPATNKWPAQLIARDD